MDKAVFLDTNGWIALLNSRDSLHLAADELWRRLGNEGYSVLLTDWVLAETGNGLARNRARGAFVAVVAALRASSRATLVLITEPLLDRALDLYAQRDDKAWGLVDCASFVVMQDRGVRVAFTTDKHFEQAGFEPLLAES